MLSSTFPYFLVYAVLYLVAFGPLFITISVAADLTPPISCQHLRICDLSCNSKCQIHQHTSLSRRLEGPPAAALEAVTVSNAAKPTPTNSAESMDSLIQRVVRVAEIQAQTTSDMLDPAKHKYPQSVESGGRWKQVPAGDWTSGFFPGVLWQLYELTGKPQWANLAQQWQAALAEHQRDWWSQHDYGFIYMPSFAHSYEVTKSPSDLRQALAAAEALAWAFNPATRSLRTFEGWDPNHHSGGFRQVVIMDFMMNIPMLTWAAKHVGQPNNCDGLRMDRDPAATYMSMAIEHARQVAANHLRPDGTSWHIVEYQPVSAEINKKYTYQGYADNSTWSRGHSWAVAGFAIMYKETQLPEFLEAAKKVTDAWLTLLTKQEAVLQGQFVPKWDFDYPYDPATDGPRDSSAAAIAALGMLHLAEVLRASECGQKYLCAAVNTLQELASSKYLATPGDRDFPALLKHATGNHPIKVQIDTGLIYGDYYFLAALRQCAQMEECRTYGQQQAGH